MAPVHGSLLRLGFSTASQLASLLPSLPPSQPHINPAARESLSQNMTQTITPLLKTSHDASFTQKEGQGPH